MVYWMRTFTGLRPADNKCYKALTSSLAFW